MRAKEWIPQSDRIEEMKMQEENTPFFATKKGRGISALFMLVIIALVLSFSISQNSGAVTYQMNDEMMGITCMDCPPLFISYEDVMA